MSSRKFAPFYLLTALKKEVIYNQIFFFTYQLGGGLYQTFTQNSNYQKLKKGVQL